MIDAVRSPAGRTARLDALIWRRSDIHETSRLVTLLTRERGRIVCLAKGAHRTSSVLFGRVDLLNRIEARIVGRGAPILGGARLVHEPRGLRDPIRWLAACHLVQLFDAAWIPERVDQELFDLTTGAITLVERAPLTTLPVVIAGIELRLLATLGRLGDLERCAACGQTLDGGHAWASPRDGSLSCEHHRTPGARGIPLPALRTLARFVRTPARAWIDPIAETLPGAAHVLLETWLTSALEFRPTYRQRALRAAAAARAT